MQRLAGFGVPARTLVLDGLHHGPALAERARRARLAALTGACMAAGCVDLLLGHHALDQAETVLMRTRAGSGPIGLAGMALLTETPNLRLLRPMLPIAPERLRATLRAAGLAWVEDRSNRDIRALRTRLRQELAHDPALSRSLLAAQAVSAAARQRDAEADACLLAASATLHPEGFAILPPAPLPPAAVASVLRCIAGSAYPPNRDSVRSWCDRPRPVTLAGVRIMAAGRLGPGWLLVREAAAVAPPMPAAIGARWDRRFVLHGAAMPPGLTVGALGDDAAGLRHRSSLPAAVLRVLPALRRPDETLVSVPQLGYGTVPGEATGLAFAFRPPLPASEADLFITA